MPDPWERHARSKDGSGDWESVPSRRQARDDAIADQDDPSGERNDMTTRELKTWEISCDFRGTVCRGKIEVRAWDEGLAHSWAHAEHGWLFCEAGHNFWPEGAELCPSCAQVDPDVLRQLATDARFGVSTMGTDPEKLLRPKRPGIDEG